MFPCFLFSFKISLSAPCYFSASSISLTGQLSIRSFLLSLR